MTSNCDFNKIPQDHISEPDDDEEDNHTNSLFLDNTIDRGLKNGRVFKGSQIGEDSNSGSAIFIHKNVLMILGGSFILLGNFNYMLSLMFSNRNLVIS